MSRDKKKIRIGIIMESDVRAAMLAVRDIVRIIPSHQVDLALRAYYRDNYAELLERHGIKV